MIRIEQVVYLPDGFDTLLNESEAEGFGFVQKLATEWASGENRFALPGEGLYAGFQNEKLIAIGGINLDPYQTDENTGRLRRFYVRSAYRRLGVGRKLLETILTDACDTFAHINLRTVNPDAAAFYINNGFTQIKEETITHLMKKETVTHFLSCSDKIGL